MAATKNLFNGERIKMAKIIDVKKLNDWKYGKGFEMGIVAEREESKECCVISINIDEPPFDEKYLEKRCRDFFVGKDIKDELLSVDPNDLKEKLEAFYKWKKDATMIVGSMEHKCENMLTAVKYKRENWDFYSNHTDETLVNYKYVTAKLVDINRKPFGVKQVVLTFQVVGKDIQFKETISSGYADKAFFEMFMHKECEIKVKSDEEQYTWEPRNKKDMMQCMELYRELGRVENFMKFTEETFLTEF